MKRHESTTTFNRTAPVDMLPEAPELERAVLGALILEPDRLPDVAEIIEKSTFSDTNNGNIFDVMLSMSEQNEKIDLYILIQRCKNLTGKDRPSVYITGLTQAVGSGANVLDHARQLKELENRRRLVLLGTELSARANDGENTVDEVNGWVTRQIEKIAATTARVDDITPLSDIISATLDGLEQRQQAIISGECVGVPTGLKRLDALTGGWRGGQLVVLAGRPAMGKSAVMLHFANIAASSGIPVCIFSLEMPAEQLAGRMLVGGADIDPGAFRTGNVDMDGWSKLEHARVELSGLPVYLNDRANISIHTIRSQCRAMQRRGCCGMVVIDYLQLLDTADRNTNSTREREIAAASRAAKLLAKEIGVPVILLSQLSRKVEERTDKTPLLSDLRESGAIEQDADMVIFIDRPAVYGIQTIDTNRYGAVSSEGVGVLHIAKNREGATGRIYFRHNPSMTRITDYEPEPEDKGNDESPKTPF